MKKENLSGYMEFFSKLASYVLDADLAKLQSAADISSIHTFGWPIAPVILENPELKPRPISGEAIGVEIESKEGMMGYHYDLWTLSKAGNFHILASLFEDARTKNQIFLDTRTIRTAETLLRTGGLYRALGVPLAEKVGLRIEYGGLKDRILTVASSNRMLMPKKCSLNMIEHEFEETVEGLLDAERVKQRTFEIVKRITEVCEMFVPSKESVTDPLVDAFIAGRIS